MPICSNTFRCTFAPSSHEERESEQELIDQVAFVDEQPDPAQKRIAVKRREMKLGYLKLANQARRWSHLRNDSQRCREPAMDQREFWLLNPRGYDCEINQR